MGAVQNIVDRVRRFMAMDKERGGELLAKGSTSPTYPDSGYDLLQAYGYDALSDYLRLEHDLLSRFVDYEEMDDYPEIASAVDVYADDASQPDTQLQRSVWVSSPDKTLQGVLDDLFYKRLRLDEEIWEITRSLIKYGNNYEEMLVTSDGVVGLNFLPAPTVRRVEGPRGELYGFVQDFKGRFGYSPQEFQKILAQRTEAIRMAMQPGGVPPAGDLFQRVSALEPWEVAHFRLRGKHRRSVYGYCLTGDSRVWTTDGVKAIEDVRPGDRVWTRHAGLLRSTVVLDHVCNGPKPVYRLKTKHREIRLTAEHPVLVDRGGKNNAWVPVSDLSVGDKIVAATTMPESRSEPPLGIMLSELRADARVRLTERGATALRTATRRGKYAPRDIGLRAVARGVGVSRGALEELLALRGGISMEAAEDLFRAAGVPIFDGSVVVVTDERLNLPDFMEPWFARLWGFLVGDGWVTDTQVCWARGVDEDVNRRYERMFEDMGLSVGYCASGDGSNSKVSGYVSSTVLVRVFDNLGWVGGAHNKRVPLWAFSMPEEHRREFLLGYVDADGWVTKDKYLQVECCNEALLRDVKALVDGLGWTSGNVKSRSGRETTFPNGITTTSSEAFSLFFHETPLSDGDFASEEVLSIEADGEEPVYDICVADASHCFVADGLVVHNSVLEPARWIWKRLMLLEDAAMIYRLQRAPERYAFYVDVGDLPPGEALAFVNKVRQQHKKKRFVNPSTGKLDLKFEPIAQDDDFWVPVRKGVEGTRIEVLGGPSWQHMDDVQYFQTKMFSALKVPKAYLAQDDNTARAVLSSEDVRFARSVLRVQREVRNGLGKIARTHLAALNVDPYSVEYSIHMTVPSAIFELAQLEVRNARADLAARMREHVSLRWVLENVYQLSNEDIKIIIQERSEDTIREGKAQAEVEKLSALAQAAAQGATTPPEVGGESTDPRDSLSGLRLLERRLAALPSKLRGAISEKEFLRGDRSAEKRAEGKLDRILRENGQQSKRLQEVGALLRDIVAAANGR